MSRNIKNKVTGSLVNITTYDPVTGEITGFTPVGNIDLGPVANVHILGGSSGQVLTTDGTGNLSWATGGGGGNGTPGGANAQVQFNDAGTFGGDAGLTYNKTTDTLTAGTYVGSGSGLSAIAGANVTGTVANAAFATLAATANTVAGANVTGTVANANVSNTAGTVTTAAQPNITSTGTLTALSVSGNTNLTGANVSIGNIANLKITGGNNGQFLQTDGNGNLSFAVAGSGNGSPGGTNTQVQFNDGGNFAGDAGLTYNSSTDTLSAGNLSVPGEITSNGTAYVGNLSTTGQASITTLVVGDSANLGNIGNVTIIGGTDGQFLSTDGNGNLSWATGGSGGSELVNGNNSFVLDSTGSVVFEGDVAGNAVQRGIVWDYGANRTGVNSEIRQDSNGLSLHAWTENSGGANGYSAPVTIFTNQDADEKQWVFDGDGNLTLPGNLRLQAGNIVSNFISPVFNSAITGITTGNATVIVTLVDGPFNDPVQGRVTISGVTGTTEANDTWYYQAVEENEFELFTDDTFTTPVDGTSWTTYVSGGNAVSTGAYSNLTIQGGNVSINSNSETWAFGSDGNLTLAGGNGVIQSIANSSLDPINPNVSTMVLTPSTSYSAQALVLDPTFPGHIHLRAPGANIDEPVANIFLGGETSSFEVGYHNGAAPNLFIHSNSSTWTFDNTGNLTLPGNTFAVNYANGEQIPLGGGNSIADGNSNVVVTANGNVTTSVGGTANVLTVTSEGANVFGTIYASGNITGFNFTTDGEIITSGNIHGTNLFITGESELGSVSNVIITGGTVDQILSTDGTGNLSWVDKPTAQAGGGNTEIQFNDANSLAGSANFTYNSATDTVSLTTLVAIGDISGNNATFAANLSANNATIAESLSANAITANSLALNSIDIILGANAGVTAVPNVGTVAIGHYAGGQEGGNNTVSIGTQAGYYGANVVGDDTVAIGNNAAYWDQNSFAVAIGSDAGAYNQQEGAVAIGRFAAAGMNSSNVFVRQAREAVAIGSRAAAIGQGEYSIAIGANAGFNVTDTQPNNSIVLNASGENLQSPAANTFVVKPVRDLPGNTLMYYDATTGEITYSAEGNILAENGLFSGNLTVSGTTTFVNQQNLTIETPIIQLGVSNNAANGEPLLVNDGKDRGVETHTFGANLITTVLSPLVLANEVELTDAGSNALIGQSFYSNAANGAPTWPLGTTVIAFDAANNSITLSEDRLFTPAQGDLAVVGSDNLQFMGYLTTSNLFVVASSATNNLDNITVVEYGNLRAENLIANGTQISGNITATGNISSSDNISASGNVSAVGATFTGNVSAARVNSGNVTVTTNITTSNITVANTTTADAVTANTLTVTGITNLGESSNVKIFGGVANYVLKTDGAGNLAWGLPETVPSGANYTVQYKLGNSLASSSSFTFDAPNLTLNVAGNVKATTLYNNGYKVINIINSAPTYIPEDETFIVPENHQSVFYLGPTVDGVLIVDGLLYQV